MNAPVIGYKLLTSTYRKHMANQQHTSIQMVALAKRPKKKKRRWAWIVAAEAAQAADFVNARARLFERLATPSGLAVLQAEARSANVHVQDAKDRMVELLERRMRASFFKSHKQHAAASAIQQWWKRARSLT
eukprot:INCI7221.16.p2 GENE.INCI7221.16~~INCI7221.16.p2  ORF type:complete len:132 (-),score=27.44 INCI7221.16:162-557(-)